MNIKRNTIFSTKGICLLALLTALQIVLGNLLQFPLLSKQYSVGFLPIVVAGFTMGAPGAMIVAGLGDLIGAHLFPQGAYFVGFTITNVLVGFLYGFFLYQKPCTWVRSLLLSLLVIACYWALNSIWLSILYTSNGYLGWLLSRLPFYALDLPLYTVLTYLVCKPLNAFLSRFS